MSKYNGEKVLVVPRDTFVKAGYFQGVSSNADLYLKEFMASGVAFFMDREQAEKDPSFKQIIAYGIFRHQGRILHYTRSNAGGESRLHDKGSLGIGGHINPVDLQGEETGLETYLAGVEREIREELKFDCSFKQSVIGLINDDSNDVGAVHLGVVHLFELDGDGIESNEDAIANIRFLTVDELKSESLFSRLETWSQITLELFS